MDKTPEHGCKFTVSPCHHLRPFITHQCPHRLPGTQMLGVLFQTQTPPDSNTKSKANRLTQTW